MLNIGKTTSCGRFRVTIRSETDNDVVSVADGVASLLELSDILRQGAETAAQLATRLLDGSPTAQRGTDGR